MLISSLNGITCIRGVSPKKAGFNFKELSMYKVPLTQNKVALIDDADAEEIIGYRWNAHNVKGIYYAERTFVLNGKKKVISLHQQLMKPPAGMEVDHRNGNTLDNRRGNLRVCTHHENMMNRGRQKNNRSGYKGVDWSHDKWRARISVCGVEHRLGHYTCLVKAARAYDDAAKIHFGEFARLNFPDN